MNDSVKAGSLKAWLLDDTPETAYQAWAGRTYTGCLDFLSNKLAVHVRSDETPLGICSSSGTVGHSLSMGRADVACVLAKSTSLADAAATALGNRVRSASGINQALEWIQGIEDVMGALIIVKEKMGAWGRVDLQPV